MVCVDHRIMSFWNTTLNHLIVTHMFLIFSPNMLATFFFRPHNMSISYPSQLASILWQNDQCSIYNYIYLVRPRIIIYIYIWIPFRILFCTVALNRCRQMGSSCDWRDAANHWARHEFLGFKIGKRQVLHYLKQVPVATLGSSDASFDQISFDRFKGH